MLIQFMFITQWFITNLTLLKSNQLQSRHPLKNQSLRYLNKSRLLVKSSMEMKKIHT
jgi:hypothetical protein